MCLVFFSFSQQGENALGLGIPEKDETSLFSVSEISLPVSLQRTAQTGIEKTDNSGRNYKAVKNISIYS